MCGKRGWPRRAPDRAGGSLPALERKDTSVFAVFFRTKRWVDHHMRVELIRMTRSFKMWYIQFDPPLERISSSRSRAFEGRAEKFRLFQPHADFDSVLAYRLHGSSSLSTTANRPRVPSRVDVRAVLAFFKPAAPWVKGFEIGMRFPPPSRYFDNSFRGSRQVLKAVPQFQACWLFETQMPLSNPGASLPTRTHQKLC